MGVLLPSLRMPRPGPDTSWPRTSSWLSPVPITGTARQDSWSVLLRRQMVDSSRGKIPAYTGTSKDPDSCIFVVPDGKAAAFILFPRPCKASLAPDATGIAFQTIGTRWHVEAGEDGSLKPGTCTRSTGFQEHGFASLRSSHG